MNFKLRINLAFFLTGGLIKGFGFIGSHLTRTLFKKGSDRLVSTNSLADIIIKISGKRIKNI
jgi:hypothetical protein